MPLLVMLFKVLLEGPCVFACGGMHPQWVEREEEGPAFAWPVVSGARISSGLGTSNGCSPSPTDHFKDIGPWPLSKLVGAFLKLSDPLLVLVEPSTSADHIGCFMCVQMTW